MNKTEIEGKVVTEEDYTYKLVPGSKREGNTVPCPVQQVALCQRHSCAVTPVSMILNCDFKLVNVRNAALTVYPLFPVLINDCHTGEFLASASSVVQTRFICVWLSLHLQLLHAASEHKEAFSWNYLNTEHSGMATVPEQSDTLVFILIKWNFHSTAPGSARVTFCTCCHNDLLLFLLFS